MSGLEHVTKDAYMRAHFYNKAAFPCTSVRDVDGKVRAEGREVGGQRTVCSSVRPCLKDYPAFPLGKIADFHLSILLLS